MTTPPLFPENDAFDNVRLPEDIERGAQIGPQFQTTIITLTSGREQRNSDWSQELLKADISYGMMKDLYTGRTLAAGEIESSFKSVLEFYRARRGQWRGFRFKDWSDFEAKLEYLGNSGTEFQLTRLYGSDYLRKITRPVFDTVEIFVDGVPATFTHGPLGKIILDAPATGDVHANFEYDVPVRFNADLIHVQLVWARAGSIPSIPLVGIRE